MVIDSLFSFWWKITWNFLLMNLGSGVYCLKRPYESDEDGTQIYFNFILELKKKLQKSVFGLNLWITKWKKISYVSLDTVSCLKSNRVCNFEWNFRFRLVSIDLNDILLYSSSFWIQMTTLKWPSTTSFWSVTKVKTVDYDAPIENVLKHLYSMICCHSRNSIEKPKSVQCLQMLEKSFTPSNRFFSCFCSDKH